MLSVASVATAGVTLTPEAVVETEDEDVAIVVDFMDGADREAELDMGSCTTDGKEITFDVD